MVSIRPGVEDPEAFHILLYFAWFSLRREGEWQKFQPRNYFDKSNVAFSFSD